MKLVAILSDIQTGNNFMAGMLVDTLHVQQLSNKPGTAAGIVEKL